MRPFTPPLKLLLLPALLAALVAVAPACVDDDDPDATAEGTSTPTSTATEAGTTPSTLGSDAPSSGTGTTSDAQSDAGLLTDAVTRVVEQARPSVVQITNQQALSSPSPFGGSTSSDMLVPAGVGSGVVIDDEGHILTNNHVIEGAQSVIVRFTDGREFEAQIVGQDPQTDLAVLHVEADDLPVASIGESGDLLVGEWVVAIGNALGLIGGPTVTTGVVSAVGRTVQEPPTESGSAGSFLFDVIQTDAAINPGNSGGPLLDLAGEVIGINTLGAGTTGGIPVQGISFAIAIDTALPLAEEMIETGTVTHPYLGIFYAPLNPAIAGQLGAPLSRGALVREVAPNSPAADAGIQPGDIIVGVDGESIEGESDLPEALNDFDVGDRVEMTVRRGDEEVRITATLEQAPDTASEPSGTPGSP